MHCRETNRGEVSEGGRKRWFFFPQIKFFEKRKFFEKVIDGRNGESFADSLSLKRKLFEIYFVRLIGTPNQNSSDAGFGRHRC
jgi:hypothetical protein